MPEWGLVVLGAFVVLIVLRAVAARRLLAGDGRLAPFLVAPTILLLILPVVAIASVLPNLGLVGVVILIFLALNAFLLLRPLVRATRMARQGNAEKVVDVMGAELGEALLGSMALGMVFAIGAGLALVIYAALSGGH